MRKIRCILSLLLLLKFLKYGYIKYSILIFMIVEKCLIVDFKIILLGLYNYMVIYMENYNFGNKCFFIRRI